MTNDGGIRYQAEGHVARITIDRPRVLNALDAAAERRLRELWGELERDRDIWVVVLAAAGERAFCVGADMSPDAAGPAGLEYWTEERADGFGGIALRRTLNTPVIAAVNGLALGGGMEMVLGCDIVIAVEDARFGLTEPRVGRIALDGGVFQLVRQIPRKAAMAMLLTGAQVSAAEARRLGFVNEVVARAELEATVQRYVDDVLRCAPLSLRAIKEMVQRASDLPADEAARVRLPALVEALRSADAEEGVRAFREKRPPRWQGR